MSKAFAGVVLSSNIKDKKLYMSPLYEIVKKQVEEEIAIIKSKIINNLK